MSNAFQLVMSLAGIAYAILPFALSVWLLAGLWNACDRSRYRNMFISAVAGAGCFCLAGTAISAWNFDLFIVAHALLLALSLSAAIIINRKRRLVLPSLRPAAAMAAVVAGSGVVRALPFLIGEPSLGGGDARFHLILVEKIIRDRCLAASWLPFAQAAVSYPQGSHVLVAFVADVFRLPPHWVFNTAIAFFGAMTTGMIGVLAASSFGSRTSGLWAAASYAFLALQGGLDYHRWGGLPNCLGMLFVLLSVHLVLFGRPLPGARAMLAEFAASLLLVCALMVHDYSWLCGMLWLLCGSFFSGRPTLRRSALLAAAASLLIASPVLGLRVRQIWETAGASDLLRFHEPFITIFQAVLNLNPLLVAIFTVALLAARRAAWTHASVFVLAGLVAFAGCFVLLEYFYRAAALALSRGGDCFTALTPSRMMANASYPICVLTGWVSLLPASRFARRAILAIAALGAAMTVAGVFVAQRNVGKYRGYLEAGLWLRDNTPENAMIVGSFPFAEYLSWRETTHPPLPVSEPRRLPAVAWKQKPASPEEWLSFSQFTGRPVYFLAPPERDLAPLARIYLNDAVAVWRGAFYDAHEMETDPVKSSDGAHRTLPHPPAPPPLPATTTAEGSSNE